MFSSLKVLELKVLEVVNSMNIMVNVKLTDMKTTFEIAKKLVSRIPKFFARNALMR